MTFPLTDTVVAQKLAEDIATNLLNNQGIVDAINTTSTPLAADGVFTGMWFDVLKYGSVFVSVKANVASATDGLMVEWSNDGITKTQDDVFTIPADTGKIFTFPPAGRYIRIIYTNGSTLQTTFSLSVIHKLGIVKGSSHRLQDMIIDQDDAALVKAVLSSQDELTGFFRNILSFNGALNVTDGLVHKFGLDFFFSKETGVNTNPSSPISAGDRIITLDSVVGLSIGDWLEISEGSTVEYSFLKIINIATNDVTVNRPIDAAYSVATDVKQVDINMAVDGSITPVSFRIAPPIGVIWQFTRLMVTLVHTTAADDSKFGNLAALTRGVLLRIHRTTDGVLDRTITQWFSNSDMKTDMYDVNYTDKAGPGKFGTTGRWTFTRMGFIEEVDGTNGDYLEILIQDDLTVASNLENYTIKAQGRIFGT